MAQEAAVGSANAARRREPAARKAAPSWKAKVALVLVGLLLPLALAEATLRIAGAVLPGDYQTVSFAEAHPEFGRRNKPGAGWKKTSEYTSWIEVNSKSLRGAEIDYPKPAGEYRILVTGDSFTFAEQVNQQETFTQRLEDRLNAESAGPTYRVLNAGSNGWATANEAVYLTKEGVRFHPDVVVVALYLGNDVSDNYRRVATVQNAVEADLALRGADSFDGPRRSCAESELYTVFESGVLAKLPWWQDDGGSSSVGPPAAAHARRGRGGLDDHRAPARSDARRLGEPGRPLHGDGRAVGDGRGPARRRWRQGDGRGRRRERRGRASPGSRTRTARSASLSSAPT